MGGDRRAANLSRALPPELRHHLAILVPDLTAEIAGIAGAGAVPCGPRHRGPPRRCPRRASVSAAESPTLPAPTITVSASAGGPASDGSGRGARSQPVWRGLEVGRQHLARHRTLRAMGATVPQPGRPRLSGSDVWDHAVKAANRHPAHHVRYNTELPNPSRYMRRRPPQTSSSDACPTSRRKTTRGSTKTPEPPPRRELQLSGDYPICANRPFRAPKTFTCLSMKLSKAAETQRMSHRGSSRCAISESAPCNSRLRRCDLVGLRHEQEQGIGERTFMDKQQHLLPVFATPDPNPQPPDRQA